MKILVNQYKRSGNSRTDIGRVHVISISKLSYWVNFFNKGTEAEVEATGSFVGVKENRISGRYRIRLPNGVEIESEDMPLVMLERLLHYVGE